MLYSYVLGGVILSNTKEVLSLFSSAGIGELGIEEAGLSILVNNELILDRCKIYKENYPNVTTICGDIWLNEDKIIESWNMKSKTCPFLIYATPPCQGMSSNGAGKLLREIRKGNRKQDDSRNRLIIPTMHIIKKLHPIWVLFENVPTMNNTLIYDENNEYINIIDYIKRELGDEYVGRAEVVNCADYGIPQVRKRLITIFTRNDKAKEYFYCNKSFLPTRTHCEQGNLIKKKWQTLRETIGNFPELEAIEGKNKNDKFNKWHFVPIMSDEKYWWLKNTPEGNTAYNNQCVNPNCRFDKNKLHGSNNYNGLHSSNKNTPIYCEKCGALLPRPTIIDKKTLKRRLIKGYETAYRRMKWDKPAPTLTQNFIFESSDKKVHPSQTRVLSLYEAMVLQTISDYNFKFTINGKYINKNQCAEIIGESVPPKLIELICNKIIELSS